MVRVVAEGDARNDGDVMLAEQAVGEVRRAEAELADVHEHVEGALRLDHATRARCAPSRCTMYCRRMSNSSRMSLTALLVALERGERALLREGARVRGAVALDRVDRLRDRLRRAEIAETPAGHRVGFREAVDRDGEIVGAGQRGDADVLRAVVGELLVDLVGEDQDFLVARDLDDRRRVPPACKPSRSDCRAN